MKTAKRRAAGAALDKVYVGNEALNNVLHFEYLGSQLQGDWDDEADVRHRMDVAQAAFGSLSHMWSDHRLSRATKLRLLVHGPDKNLVPPRGTKAHMVFVIDMCM